MNQCIQMSRYGKDILNNWNQYLSLLDLLQFQSCPLNEYLEIIAHPMKNKQLQTVIAAPLCS